MMMVYSAYAGNHIRSLRRMPICGNIHTILEKGPTTRCSPLLKHTNVLRMGNGVDRGPVPGHLGSALATVRKKSCSPPPRPKDTLQGSGSGINGHVSTSWPLRGIYVMKIPVV